MHNRPHFFQPSSLFIDDRNIYHVMCQHLDLEALAKVAATGRLGASRFAQIVLNRPDLLLNALLNMHKGKISAFLKKYPQITQRIIAMHAENRSSPHAYALLCLVSNIKDIDTDALQNCIDYFADNGSARVRQTLEVIMVAINTSRAYWASSNNHEFNPLSALFSHNDCYMNLCGIRFENTTAHNVSAFFNQVDFSFANLEGAVFEKSSFRDVSFYKARLGGARFAATTSNYGTLDIRGADFNGAFLYQCKWMGRDHAQSSVLYDGANFHGARFFGDDILSWFALSEALTYLPTKFIAWFASLDNVKHDAIKPAVLHDLLYTVNHYTEEDYQRYLAQHAILGLGQPYTSLHDAKIKILESASEHKFFKKHDNRAADYFNDLFSCGLGSNAIFSPSQRVIQREIKRIKREEANEVVRLGRR